MQLTRLSQFHENEVLIEAAQSIGGRLIVWAVATLLIAVHGLSPLLMVAISLVMMFPAQRHMLLSLAAIGVTLEKILEATQFSLQNHVAELSVLLAAGIGGLYLFYILVKHFEKWPALVKRFPILTLHVGVWFLLSLSSMPMLGALAMVPFLAWRLSYLVSLGARSKIADLHFKDHLFYLVPVYGGTQTPFGKGFEFLSRSEALQPNAFARSQLAGIKLLLLALLWVVVLEIMDAMLFGKNLQTAPAWLNHWSLNLPGIGESLKSGSYPVWYQGWATVYLELIRATLHLAVTGHVIVGCLRLLGFNVFRNTYKPLLAESILEFWNRYYYYFKELLVDFFFYPTYLRLKSLGHKTRMFAAVFAAAFLGNMYHHILADPETVIQLDLIGFWSAWGPRFVYCLLLAVGIWLSMLRQQQLRGCATHNSLPLRLRRIAGVWTFYGVIQIWNINPQVASIEDRFAFFLSLIPIINL